MPSNKLEISAYWVGSNIEFEVETKGYAEEISEDTINGFKRRLGHLMKTHNLHVKGLELTLNLEFPRK